MSKGQNTGAGANGREKSDDPDHTIYDTKLTLLAVSV
jgi:hypothetical protein